MRRELVSRRDALPREVRRRNSLLASHHALSLINQLRKDKEGLFVLTIFLSFGSEIDTRPVIAGLFKGPEPNILLLLPSIRDSRDIVLRPWKKEDPLVPSPFGILEPETKHSFSPQDVDLFIVPGVGFDPAGHRLGYGKGYYDRLLSRRNLRGTRVGMAFEEQVVPSIPFAQKDVPIHYLVTENGWRSCG